MLMAQPEQIPSRLKLRGPLGFGKPLDLARSMAALANPLENPTRPAPFTKVAPIAPSPPTDPAIIPIPDWVQDYKYVNAKTESEYQAYWAKRNADFKEYSNQFAAYKKKYDAYKINLDAYMVDMKAHRDEMRAYMEKKALYDAATRGSGAGGLGT